MNSEAEMRNWCEYWSKSRLIKVDNNSYRLINDGDTLDFFIDNRAGRTFGMIYLFAYPGTKGSTLAKGEESSFLETMVRG